MTTMAAKNGSEQLADAGVKLLERGFPIIACNGKKPKGGLAWHKQKVNERMLRIQLVHTKEPAIGLRLGPEAGIIDIEADGGEEEQLVADLFEGCEIPVTPTYTSTRGKHRFFKFDDRLTKTKRGIINFQNGGPEKLGCRVGANGKGAQSIIPPSPGRTWLVSLDDCEPAPLPDLVVERLLEAAKPKTKPATGAHSTAEGVHAKALKAMLRMDAKDGNDGSKRLYAVACRAVEHDLSDGQALATIRAYEQQKPFPNPWTDAEISHRLRDAEKRVERGASIVIANYEGIEITDNNGEMQKVAIPKSLSEMALSNYSYVQCVKQGRNGSTPRTEGATTWLPRQK